MYLSNFLVSAILQCRSISLLLVEIMQTIAVTVQLSVSFVCKMLTGQGNLCCIAGEFLQPDDVTFSVLMRGYGELNPPSWASISGLLKMMDKKFAMKPSLGDALSPLISFLGFVSQDCGPSRSVQCAVFVTGQSHPFNFSKVTQAHWHARLFCNQL